MSTGTLPSDDVDYDGGAEVLVCLWTEEAAALSNLVEGGFSALVG
jgi:hypothetical protein